MPGGGDAYVLKSIVHDWNDEDATRILRNIRNAIAPDGTLLVFEAVLPERAGAGWGSILDLEMLVSVGGRERTRAEFARLFTAAGFRPSRVVSTASPMLSIVEAIPA